VPTSWDRARTVLDDARRNGGHESELTRFAETVAQALPVLGLSPDDQQAAKTLTDQIAKAALEPEPNHSRLKVLGSRLYPILEDAADNALSAALLRLWHP